MSATRFQTHASRFESLVRCSAIASSCHLGCSCGCCVGQCFSQRRAGGVLAGLALVLHRCGESTTSSALLKTAVSVVTNPLAVTATAAATLGIDDRSNQDAVRTRGCVCCGRGCVTPHSSRMRTTAVVCGGWIRGSEDGCVRRWPSTAHVRSFPVGVYRFVLLPWPPYEVPAVTPVMTLRRFAACRADDTTNFHNMCQVRLVVGAASQRDACTYSRSRRVLAATRRAVWRARRVHGNASRGRPYGRAHSRRAGCWRSVGSGGGCC